MAISAGTIEALLRLRDEMSPALKRVGRNAQQLGTTMQGAGRAMLPISAGLLALGGGALKAAIDFETSFAGVRKTVDATEEEFGDLAQSFRDMAKEIPVSVDELNSIGEAAGQLGIDKENIVGFTRVMADLGVATNLSATEAATQLARLANITQLPQDKFDNLGATVVELGNNLATTEEEIVAFGLRLAGAGTQVGLSEADILAIGAALSSVGINAEAGGTAISRVMIDIASSVESGGEKLDQFANVAGTTAEDFATLFREDAAAAITSFVTGLGEMESRGQSTLGVLEEMGITQIRVRDALLRASGAGDLLARALDMGGTAFTENSALAEEAATRYATTESQLKLLWNQVKDVAISLGEALMPALRTGVELFGKLVPHIEKAVQWFSGLSQPTQMVIIAMAGLAIVLPPLIIMAGALVAGVGAIAAAFAAASPVVLTIVGVVAAVGAALAAAAAAWLVWGDDVVAAAQGAFDGVKAWLVDAWNSDIVQAFVGLAQSLAELFGAAMELLVAVAQKAFNGIKGWLVDKLGPVFEALQPVFDAVAEGFRIWKDQSIAQVKALVDLVKVHLVDRLAGIINSVKEKIDRVTGFFKDMKDKVVGNSFVPEMVEGVGDWMEKLPGRMLPPTKAAAGGVTQEFASFSQTVQGIFGDLISKLSGKLFGGEGGGGLAGLFGDKLGGTLRSLGTAALTAVLGPLGGVVGDFVTGLQDKVIGSIKGLFGGPSGEELEGRDLVAGFEEAVIGTLDATQQAEAGGERWKQVVIGVRDAYIAAGRTAAEAEAAVEALWQSSKDGPEATRAAIAEIESVAGDALFAAEGAADAAGASTDALAQGLANMDPEALSATSAAAEEAAAATTRAAEGLNAMTAGAETATTGVMALSDAVRAYTAAVLGVPTDITFPSPGGGAPLPSLDIGGLVPRDMVAKVHRGEVVVPPQEPRRSEVLREAGLAPRVDFGGVNMNITVQGGGDPRAIADAISEAFERNTEPRMVSAVRNAVR